MNLCKHIAIIMDGNGRWAEKQGLNRVQGHQSGAENIQNIVECAIESKIQYLTLYGFSTENWTRPKEEVDTLLRLMVSFLQKEVDYCVNRNIKLHFIGDISGFSEAIQGYIAHAIEATKNNTGLHLVFALNYGGRDEIVRAVQKLVKNNEEITEENISKSLDTAFMVAPDIIIRTAGEQRLSNFLTWQSIYSEFIFFEKSWPDFSKQDFIEALKIYEKRKRSFGGL